MKIKDEDLGVLLGNALDNAVEASEHVKRGKGEIWIEITYEKGYLYIFVRNRYQGKIEYNKENRLESRKEEAFHGWGIHSMKKIAKKISWSCGIGLGGRYIFIGNYIIR